jgi:hypothetical protein
MMILIGLIQLFILNYTYIPIKKNDSEKTEFEIRLQKFKWKFAKQKQFFNKKVKAIKFKKFNEKIFKKLKINKFLKN